MPRPIAIQETNVVRAKDGHVVQLYVSDEPRDSEGAAIRLALTATVPPMESPLLAQLQFRVLNAAADAMQRQAKALLSEIQKCGRDA